MNHELGFMLVNTVRKVNSCKHCGTKSLILYRILKVMRYQVALDNFVMMPNEVVIPAVQSRLLVLLSHEQSVTITTLPYFISEAGSYFLDIAHILGIVGHSGSIKVQPGITNPSLWNSY